jgi:hypothetical protein
MDLSARAEISKENGAAMKAIQFSRFGGADVLDYVYLPRPSTQKDDVLKCVSVLGNVLDRLASGALRLPAAQRYSTAQIGDALHDAETTGRDGKPLLDFT